MVKDSAILHIYEIRRTDFDALVLMKLKRGAVCLFFDNLYSLILADKIVNCLSFVIIYGNLLKPT